MIINKIFLSTLVCSVIFCSCKMGVSSDKSYIDNPDQQYRISLRPEAGQQFHYSVENKTITTLEINGEEQKTETENEVGVNYTIDKDSLNQLMILMQYDRIRLNTKSGEQEKRVDAESSALSNDPTERMLGMLLRTSLKASLDSNGNIVKVDGYDRLVDQISRAVGGESLSMRALAKKQLTQVLENNMVRNNLEQLYKMFPDSAIRVGDKWKTQDRQAGEITFNAESIYQLKKVEDGIATIEGSGTLESEGGAITVSGYETSPVLSGTQTSKIEVDVKSGIVIKNETKASLSGTLGVLGNNIPVKMETELTVEGKPLQSNKVND